MEALNLPAIMARRWADGLFALSDDAWVRLSRAGTRQTYHDNMNTGEG